MRAAEAIGGVQAGRVLHGRRLRAAPAADVIGVTNIPALKVADRLAVEIQVGTKVLLACQDGVAGAIGDIGYLDLAEQIADARALQRLIGIEPAVARVV